ncbi:SDR family oxidoreductase [Streptomyces sp. NPDC001153]
MISVSHSIQRHLPAPCQAPRTGIQTAHLLTPGIEGAGGCFDALSLSLSGAGTALVIGEVAGHGIHAYASQGIRVNTVALGVIRTPMHPVETHEALAGMRPLGRMGEIDDVVEAIVYLEQALLVTGEILHVDGGQSAGHRAPLPPCAACAGQDVPQHAHRRRRGLRQLGVTPGPGAFRASFRTTGVGTSEAGSA